MRGQRKKMNEELKVIISAEVSKLKQGIENAKQQVNKLQSKFKEASKTIKEDLAKAGESASNVATKMGAGFAAIGASLIAAAASTEEYRNQQAQLITAFEAAGASAETAKETYNDLYRVLGDGGQAQEAAQHLAKLGTTQENLQEITHSLQGVYSVFGASLPLEGLAEGINHTVKLGEVQGSLADALEWSGISTDSFNEKLAACNSEAEREKLIRETLTGLYGEAADKYEKNNKQVLAQRDAQAKLQETLAKVGEAIAPVITAFTSLAADALAKLTPIITQLAEKYMPKLQEILTKVGEAIGIVINWIVNNWDLISTIAAVVLSIVAAFTALNAAMKVASAVSALFSMNPIVLAIGAVIAIIVLCVKHWDDIKEAGAKAFEGIKKAWDKAGQWFKGVVDKIKQAFSNIGEWFRTLFTNAWEGIKSAWGSVKQWFSNLWNNIKNVFSPVINFYKTTFTNAWNAIKSAWGVVVSWFRNIWTSITGVFSVVGSWFGNIFTTAWNNIRNAFSGITGFFSGIWENIKSIFSRVGTAIATGIKGAVSSAVNSVLKTAANIINGFISAINFAIGIINKIPGVNISKLKKLDVPQMARGGIVDSATLAVVGEQGKEAVVPLENNLQWLDKLAGMLNDRMGGGSQPIVLMVDGKVFAQTAVSSINQLTRQTGTLGLVMA